MILFHRSAAAPWGHVASIIKRSPTGDSLSFGSTTTTVSIRSIVAALDGIHILVPSTTQDPRAMNAHAEFKGIGHTQLSSCRHFICKPTLPSTLHQTYQSFTKPYRSYNLNKPNLTLSCTLNSYLNSLL